MKGNRRLIPIALGLALAGTVHAQFSIPHWAGDEGAEFSQWEVFASAFGAPNSPDVVESTGDALLQQHTPGAITIESSGNIYNPAGPSVFTVVDTFETQPQVVVFQTKVLATPLDADSVFLEFESCGETVRLPADREQLGAIDGAVYSRWTWDTRHHDVSQITIHFASAGPHCSFSEARLDVLPKPDGTIQGVETASDDRWNYPFNATPGTRAAAPVFAAPVTEGEGEVLAGWDRHGSFVFAFDTSGVVEPGRGENAYEIVSASVVLETTSSVTFEYDPTFDTVETYLNAEHPDFVADSDAGRPMELFGAGFRNGASAATWTETAAYSSVGFGPADIIPVSVDLSGNEVDAYKNVRFADPYEVTPFGVGVIEGATPGEPAPADSEVRFNIDVCHPGIAAYLRNSLNAGRLVLTAASLHGNAGQSGGVYPVFLTRDSLLSDGPRLELEVHLYGAEETITVTSLSASSPTARALRFPGEEAHDYGIRWTEDFKNWFLIHDPVLTNPETGVVEWIDDDSEAGSTRFYQVYRKP